MSAIFGEHYYSSINYADYLERGDRYDRLADEIMTHLEVHNLNRGPVLDFGCAVGMLLESLGKLGYDAYGVDVSEWALSKCREKDLTVYDKIHYDTTHGVTFALDVLEHIPEKDMRNTVANLQTKVLVFRMPICREGDNDYYLECSRADPTHIIRWTKKQWRKFFIDLDFIPLDLNLHTIYNSPGVYSGMALHQRYLELDF